MISLSENAAGKIKQLVVEKPGAGLRVKVIGGGCSRN
jgi:Fe-S cluster assembly iron-binding protein IscA